MATADSHNIVQLDDYDDWDTYSSDNELPPDLPENGHPCSGVAFDLQSQPKPFANEITSLTSRLDSLTAQAQSVVSRQPRKTQFVLARSARKLFENYEHYGSAIRLSNDLMKFLRHGSGDGLEIEIREGEREVEEADEQPDLRPHAQVESARGEKDETNGNRTIDEESHSLVPGDTGLPFCPVDRMLTYRSDAAAPPEGYLGTLDTILSLYSLHGQSLLRHHVNKYGPQPIFRTGIRALLNSQLESILVPASDDEYGLTHESRTFLRSVFERSPELNIAEKRMLSRATRVGVRTIEMFWEDLWLRRRAWFGMRAFVAAREIERGREAEHGMDRGLEVEEECVDGNDGDGRDCLEDKDKKWEGRDWEEGLA